MDHKSHGSDQYVDPRLTSVKIPARTSTLQNVVEQRKTWYVLAYLAGVVSVLLLPFGHKKLFLLAGALGYLFLVQLLRFDRKKSLEKRFGYLSEDAFSKMTLDEAHAIHKELVELEFPILFHKALEFALFRVSTFTYYPFTEYLAFLFAPATHVWHTSAPVQRAHVILP